MKSIKKHEPVISETPPAADVKTDIAAGQPAVERCTLALAEVTVDKTVMGRAETNPATVEQYAERVMAGDVFPPIVAFHVDDKYILVDGFHRYEAAQKAGHKSATIEIHHGTRQDAVQFAVQANTIHGLPRTNADKHHVVKLALQELSELSDRRIADLCKVSPPLVGKIRAQLKTDSKSNPRTGRDGKTRKHPRRREDTSADAKSKTTGNPDQGEADPTGAEDDASDGPSADESEDPQADEATETNSFVVADECNEVEKYLCSKLERWPVSHRTALAQCLREFADKKCK